MQPPSARLIFLLHGSHGRACDFGDLTALLRARHQVQHPGSESLLRIRAPDSIERSRTDVGIERAISTLVPSIEAELRNFSEECKARGATGNVSVCGHSLGGVLLRGALGRLDRSASLLLPNLSLDSFVAVASPHLGVGDASKTLQRAARWASGALPSVTYRDLLLDSVVLDSIAADPNVDRALSAFRRRILIAPTGDHLVSPASALVGPVNKAFLRRMSRECKKAPTNPSEAFVQVDAELPEMPLDSVAARVAARDQEILAWNLATPKLDEARRRRVMAMAQVMRSKGRGYFECYIAVFPHRESLISHRAVIGKPPWSGRRLRSAYPSRIADMLLGLS